MIPETKRNSGRNLGRNLGHNLGKIALRLLIAGVLLFGIFVWLDDPNIGVEENEDVLVKWKKGSSPMQVNVFVVDKDGYPGVGDAVHVVNNSGGNVGVTDACGLTTIKVYESEVLRITMNNRVVLERSDSFWGVPSVRDSLKVLIIKKRGSS
jgi:hypothetical protein